MPTGPIIFQPTAEEGWIHATGEALPQPLQVRFVYQAGRFKLTGLRIESGQAITAAVLREIPVGQLATAYIAHLRQQLHDAQIEENQQRERLWRAHRPVGAGGVPLPAGGIGEVAADHVVSQGRLTDLLEALQRIEESGEVAELAPRGRGAKPPSDAEYRAFARIYVEERTLNERGALSRSAQRWGVNRSTAHRWLRSLPAGLLEGGTTNEED